MQARNFTLKTGTETIVLPDIDPSMTPDDIRKAYSSTYPALTNAVITYPEHDGGKDYEFTQKGAGSQAGAGKAQNVQFSPSVGRKG